MKKVLSVLLAAVILPVVLAGCGNSVYTESAKTLTEEEARAELESLMKKVDVTTKTNPTLDIYSDESAETAALADIDTFPITVQGDGDIVIEVAAATELRRLYFFGGMVM